MTINIKRNKTRTVLIIFTIIYILFVIADMVTSAQSGFRGADRTVAHILILILTVFLLIFSFSSKIRFNSGIAIMLFLLLCWTTLINIISGDSMWEILVLSNMGLQWLLSYLFWKKYSKIDKKILNFFLWCIWIFLIIMELYYFIDMMSRLNRIPVLNVSYYIIALVPWLIVLNDKKRLLIYVLAIVASLLAMKRGAIISIILMILTDYFVQTIITKKVKPFVRTALMIVLFVFALIIANYLSDGFLSKRFSREELASGSGRFDQIVTVLNQLKNTNLFHWIFGSGSSQSIELVGTGIHNEWLSFLYCYGIVGFVLYAALIFNLFIYSSKTAKVCPSLAPSSYMMAVFILVLSMVSATYGEYVGLWLYGFWGFIESKKNLILEKKNEIM